VLFFKCINISDVNIEKIFEIRGIQLSVDIILTVYSYRARKERYSIQNTRCRVLSDIIRSAAPRVLYLIKHSYSCFK
jgi:hypothetical protein